MPHGGYVPRFEAAEAVPPTTTRWWIWPAALGVACLAALLIWAFSRAAPSDELGQLWRPVANSKAAVMIGLLSPEIYAVQGGQPTAPVPPDKVIKVTNYFVGTGAAYGAAQVAAMLASWGGRFVVKIGQDVSYEDLKNQPAVFLGAHSSAWTMAFSQKLRYQSLEEANETGIVDTENPTRRWMRRNAPNLTDLTEDYASWRDSSTAARTTPSCSSAASARVVRTRLPSLSVPNRLSPLHLGRASGLAQAELRGCAARRGSWFGTCQATRNRLAGLVRKQVFCYSMNANENCRYPRDHGDGAAGGSAAPCERLPLGPVCSHDCRS